MTDASHNYRGRWVFPKRRRGKFMAHLINIEGKAFCGRPLHLGIAMDPEWNPADHPDNVCSRCFEWYKLITPHPST
jgi:hypothetical protein